MRSIRDFKSQATRLTLVGLIVGAVLISFSGVWVKVAHVTPNVSAFYRVMILFRFPTCKVFSAWRHWVYSVMPWGGS